MAAVRGPSRTICELATVLGRHGGVEQGMWRRCEREGNGTQGREAKRERTFGGLSAGRRCVRVVRGHKGRRTTVAGLGGHPTSGRPGLPPVAPRTAPGRPQTAGTCLCGTHHGIDGILHGQVCFLLTLMVTHFSTADWSLSPLPCILFAKTVHSADLPSG